MSAQTSSTDDRRAGTVLRLAVLLDAGASPMSAWRHLADTGDVSAHAVVAATSDGRPLDDAIADLGPGWADVAAAWHIARTVGAPLAQSLRGIGTAVQDAARTRDEVTVALAEPAGTARLLSWLPVVGLFLGAVLGFDTMRIVATTPAGIACVAVGCALILVARRWSGVLVRRAQPDGLDAGLTADLFAIALAGGASFSRAASLVDGCGMPPLDDESEAVLRLSRTAGVPAVELLRAAATLSRHRVRVEGRLQAAQLSTRLLLPLGVCTLPAFLVLGVAPLLLSILTTTPLVV